MSLRQWLWLSLLASFWGGAFILMEIALPVFSPLAIVSSRMTVAAIVLNGVLFSQGQRWPKRPGLWLQCAGLSLLGNLMPFGLVVWGQQYISASLASILIAAAPIFTVVLAVFVLKEQLTLSRLLGALLGFGGVVVLIGPEVLNGFSLQGLGELAILGAAMSYALAGFWGGRFTAIPVKMLSTMTVTMGALIMVSSLLGLAVMPGVDLGAQLLAQPLAEELTGNLMGHSISRWPWAAGLAMVGLGVFSTALAYLIYYRLLGEVGVIKTSLVSFLVPFSALLLGATFLGERLDGPSMLGMVLILSGLAVLDGRLLSRLQRQV
ncbi:MAG: DMT family transporter [Cyanobacteria bacterium P01_F01_bin.53]